MPHILQWSVWWWRFARQSVRRRSVEFRVLAQTYSVRFMSLSSCTLIKIKSVIDRATYRNNNRFERPTILNIKNQGHRSNGTNRRTRTNTQTHKQTDVTKHIISPALWSITIKVNLRELSWDMTWSWTCGNNWCKVIKSSSSKSLKMQEPCPAMRKN